MNRFAREVVAGIVASLCVAGAARAQTAQDLVGTWKAVSSVSTLPDGTRSDLFGPHPTGVLIFTAEGRFMSITLNPDTPKFASANRAQGTPEENQAAVRGTIATFGTYTVEGKTIKLKIEGCSFPNWTGTEQTRTITSFTSDELVYTLVGSTGAPGQSTWRRMK